MDVNRINSPIIAFIVNVDIIKTIKTKNAFENDMTFTDDQGKVNYPDQDTEPVMDVEVSEVVPDNQPASETAQPQQTDVASALFG